MMRSAPEIKCLSTIKDKNDANAILQGVSADYKKSDKVNLLDRWNDHFKWWQDRCDYGLDAYCKYTTDKIATTTSALDRWGRPYAGVNFASQEYLSLSSHPKIIAAAIATAQRYGVHSAGSATLMGNTEMSLKLEQQLADFLGMKECTLFSVGWGAGYGIVKTLASKNDHIVIDKLAHACLQEGAYSATKNVHSFEHLSNLAVEEKLKEIRNEAPNSGILVVTETLFSMDSDVPNLVELQEICTKYNATLVVDMAHDLGCIGETGRGYLEIQGMVGKVDIVMGSFSKTFASNGGYVASNHPALKQALRFNCNPLTFTNAMSPVNAAIVSECISIIDSKEGEARRKKLMENSVYLRSKLTENGFKVTGLPSAIIPVTIGNSAVGRLMTKYAMEAGSLVNLVEHPAIARDECRWRLQVMTDHNFEQIDQFIETAIKSKQRAIKELESLGLN